MVDVDTRGSEHTAGTEMLEKEIHLHEEQALHNIETAKAELAEALKPENKEKQEASLPLLVRVFDRLDDAVGSFFRALFGVPDPEIAERNLKVQQAAAKVQMSVEQLKGLQAIQHEFQNASRNLQGVQNSGAEAQIKSLRQENQGLEHKFRSAHTMLETLKHKIENLPHETVKPPAAGGPAHPIEHVPHAGSGPIENPEVHKPAVGKIEVPPPILERPPIDPEIGSEVHVITDEGGETEAIVGDLPEADRPYIFQQGMNYLGETGTCVVASQAMIFNHFAGNEGAASENQFLYEAVAQGIFDHGVPLKGYGELLKEHGLQVETKESDVVELLHRLSHGEMAQVSVNAGILWEGQPWDDPVSYGTGTHNHAVWISGMDIKTHSDGSKEESVIVNDSGSGQQYAVPLEQFERAWETSGHWAAYISRGEGELIPPKPVEIEDPGGTAPGPEDPSKVEIQPVPQDEPAESGTARGAEASPGAASAGGEGSSPPEASTPAEASAPTEATEPGPSAVQGEKPEEGTEENPSAGAPAAVNSEPGEAGQAPATTAQEAE